MSLVMILLNNYRKTFFNWASTPVAAVWSCVICGEKKYSEARKTFTLLLFMLGIANSVVAFIILINYNYTTLDTQNINNNWDMACMLVT